MAEPLRKGSRGSFVERPDAGGSHFTPFAGSWFPGERSELSRMLDELWEKSARRNGAFLASDPVAFVVPHAGLIYSGTVAAAAYRHLEQARPERAIVLGFSHHGGPAGVAIPGIESFQTPLGAVPIDTGFAAGLLENRLFQLSPEARVCDHSIEIQLPLLQRAAPGMPVVPLYVGRLDDAQRAEAAAVLAERLQPGTLLLASSDLTHFGSAFGFKPFPVDTRTPDRLRELDYEVMDAAGSLRDELFLETLRRTSATVCGRDPISLLLAVLQHLDRREELFQDVLDYQTSGDITGEFQHSVSYGALGYFPWHSFELSSEEQAELLGLARRTLDAYLQSGLRRASEGKPKLPGLERSSPVFVTLHRDGELRGCLGRSSCDQSLWQVIPELTIAAATEDRRFPPVTPGETGLDIEISVLSPMKRIKDRSDFKVNIHGAVLEAGSRHGLLLPQVATERNWSADMFFEALARKAGVSGEVYSDPATRLHVFRAQIIH